MKPARYIFLNKSLAMSGGKCAAQAGHAETLAMYNLMTKIIGNEDVPEVDLFNKWYGDGHYAKYVMAAEDSMQMYTIMHYLQERGFKCFLVVDEGHTEATYFVPTAMSVELVDKDDERTAGIFGEFKLYRDPPTPVQLGLAPKKKRWWRREE